MSHGNMSNVVLLVELGFQPPPLVYQPSVAHFLAWCDTHPLWET